MSSNIIFNSLRIRDKTIHFHVNVTNSASCFEIIYKLQHNLFAVASIPSLEQQNTWFIWLNNMTHRKTSAAGSDIPKAMLRTKIVCLYSSHGLETNNQVCVYETICHVLCTSNQLNQTNNKNITITQSYFHRRSCRRFL